MGALECRLMIQMRNRSVRRARVGVGWVLWGHPRGVRVDAHTDTPMKLPSGTRPDNDGNRYQQMMDRYRGLSMPDCQCPRKRFEFDTPRFVAVEDDIAEIQLVV